MNGDTKCLRGGTLIVTPWHKNYWFFKREKPVATTTGFLFVATVATLQKIILSHSQNTTKQK